MDWLSHMPIDYLPASMTDMGQIIEKMLEVIYRNGSWTFEEESTEEAAQYNNQEVYETLDW